MSAPLDRAGPASRAGETCEAISRRMVQLHKELYGKGPMRAKTYYYDDVVTVLMRGGFTAVEETLFQSGRSEAVARQRSAFQGAMTSRFTEMVTEETGRPVIAFMSTSHQHPDLVAELFLLAPTDILDDSSSESLLDGEVGSATARDDHPPRGETGSGPA
jgi:uncharacterized protein YbcI